jgi:tRNA (guanine-N7-)-methyltransferase
MRKPKRVPLEELQPYLWLATDQPGPPWRVSERPETLDWQLVFARNAPIEIEVGFGKGAFLLAAAEACPHVNFFGIEIVRKYQLFAATRIAKRRLTNVRLACADARHFLQVRVPVGTVQAIHAYFPDPWWKKRHHKRRVFTADFVVSCVKALRVGGRLYLATDVPDYFAIMTELCAAQRGLTLVADAGPAHGLQYLTNFERKARQQGQPILRAVYEKSG